MTDAAAIDVDKLHDYGYLKPEFDQEVGDIASSEDAKAKLTERMNELESRKTKALNLLNDHKQEWKVNITRNARNLKE